MSQLRAYSTKVLLLHLKYIIESYHRKVDDQGKCYEYGKLRIYQPVLFNPKKTGVKSDHKLFNFGVIDGIRLHHNIQTSTIIRIN